MPVYTVHVAQTDGQPLTAFERMVLVCEGFNFRAFVFGPLWLLFGGLWLALAGWLCAAVLIGVVYWLAGLSGTAASLIYWGSALVLGLEAGSLQRMRLARKGFVLVDVASGSTVEEAERRFLSRRERTDQAHEGATAQRNVPRSSGDASGWPQIGGLFPSGGAP